MTFGRKKEEPVVIPPPPPAQPAPVPPQLLRPREFTLLEKEQRQLTEAKTVLFNAQQEVARLQANISWLELNPMAEKIFKELLEREIRERDKLALDRLVIRGSTDLTRKEENSGQEKEEGRQAGAGTK